MLNKDDSTLLEKQLLGFIKGNTQETQNLHQMKTLSFFVHMPSVSILGQILVYFTFLHFSLTLFKGHNSKAKAFRSAIHFFEKSGHCHYIIIASQDISIKTF